MDRWVARIMASVCLLAPACGDAAAQAAGAGYRLGPLEIRKSGPDRLFFGLGAFDFNQDQKGKTSFAANPEYRFGRKLFGIGPALGLDVNADRGLYGYLGLYADLAFGPVVVTPLAAAGAYREGDSFDLGGVFEFRTSLDVACEFDNRTRLGVRIAHLSNADINDDNPGVEELFATFSIPLPPLF